MKNPGILAAGLFALALAGCADEPPPAPAPFTEPAAPATSDRQTAFRVRADFEADLNAEGGWAAGVNQPATVEADRPFRVRFEVAAGDAEPDPRRFQLQVRRNAGDWQALAAEDFPYPLKVHELPSGETDHRSEPVWKPETGSLARSRWVSEAASGHWRFDSGEQPLLAISQPAIEWQPSEFSLSVRLDDQPRAAAGIVFAYRDRDHHARVDLIRPDTVRLVRVESGETLLLAEHSLALASGEWLDVAIEIAAGEVGIEIGDEALAFSEPLTSQRPTPALGVHLPAGHSVGLRDPVLETEARSPRASIIRAGGFEHGAPTRDLLSVSSLPFTGGAGISFAERTPAWSAEGGHGEWSFPIVIRRFADEAAFNEAGDRFDFRLVAAGGVPLPAQVPATVTLAVPQGHLGGTFVETPMRVGPWQAGNGSLYFIMEPSETWNRIMIVKSSDGGRTWREVDGSRRPETGDLEGLGSTLVDGRIHILHQVSDEVFYHVFNTSDHAQDPDTWAVRDERVAVPEPPPTQVADLAVRSDGSVVAVYGAEKTIRYRIRSPEGHWGEERAIDDRDGAVLSGPSIVVDRADRVHLAYTASDGSGWYRRIEPDDSASEAVRFASDLGTADHDVGAILPLLHRPESDSVSIIYRARDGRLRERSVDNGDAWSEALIVAERTVVQNAVDSDQAGADAVADGNTLHVLFIEDGTGDLFHAARRGTAWTEARRIVTDSDVQWVRGTMIESEDGERVYGFVYDAGSDGGSGRIRYMQLGNR